MPMVLIVDDKSESVYLLQTLLHAHGFEVMTAANGREALESARRRPPDLIISDILMPVMDGFSLCREWKKDETLRSILFIFYTATYTDSRDEEFALSLGADLFIRKPIDPGILLRLILDTVEKHRTPAGAPPVDASPEEIVYLKEYNQTLIRRLESKVLELEEANKALAVKDFAIASAISGILLIDFAGRLTYVNATCAEMWGYAGDELLGRDVRTLIADEAEVARLVDVMRREGNWVGETDARRKDGTAFTVHLAAHRVRNPGGATLCIMASCIDVTEQKRMREELQRSQRFESLSLFAAGIAHDFNNLLTGLFVGLELLKDDLPPRSPTRDHFPIVMSVFTRARDLTQRLLAFSKGGSPVRKKLKVSDVVRESCALSLSGSHVRHTVEEDDGVPLVEADANQLSQVFNNIIINSRQAMGDHGTLAITLRNCPLTEESVGTLPSGSYVAIRFDDTGPGIPEAIIGRIFDPFFTTKKEGSGLGLATSYAIVKNHGGHIAAASNPGGGASFTVWLPALREGKVEVEAQPPGPAVSGVGRILLMDDERAILTLTKHTLVNAGYEVSTACNGEEAVALFRQGVADRRPYDLCILDLTIRGGMGGVETLTALRAIAPETAALASSGYADAGMVSQIRKNGFLGLLPKPYLAHELLSTVTAAIGRKPMAPP